MNLRSLLPLAACFAWVLPAAAQTVINAVPYTITQSGKYVLGANFITASSAQTAITVNAPNVIVDLNGFFVSGPGDNTASKGVVIRVGDVSNVTIRNGTVANNGYGILFEGGVTNSINHLVEDVNVTRCLIASLFLMNRSSGTIFRRNVISQNGGSTALGTASVAIALQGGVRVERNTITDVTPGDSNVVIGISAFPTDFLIRNAVTRSTVGIFGGKYQNNLFISCTTPFTGGVNAGGNN